MSDIGNKEIFARNLRFYIQQSGKTQKQLAQIVDVAQSTFNDWATGKKYPRIDKIEILASYFGILKSDLIEDKEKEESARADGFTEDQIALIDFARSLPEDKAALALRLLQSIVEDD